ncbi:NAD(P)/FAD-dependent oxidoreductase [Shewanella sp. D64]|uniref:NAD(P)/FAD-dependent oxidoreductase n=1 Tax=unclassified Shewanella TaxID=196818 RepID=UPI0022BA6E33|nr:MULTISPECIES: NAD(P)/FAD-dependent oxidoreductase [unclassified Shewanella]MEC4727683.1 NAD(P)/FAD-dependent oxidoreductase [Shewanella sp. D64]MEC4739744.1 NAD(P)/FAD-dependent oxidoreductase [Shewanella sp. E94]WBJ94079.1 NAD(P)/FAD-dependent oxidoreductase [Shewanella sp. MTB7]
MIRLSNIKLDLDHAPEELTQAILTMLNISADELIETVVFRRGIDARSKNQIFLLYTLDVTTSKDEALLEQFADNQSIKATPDMSYKFVAQAPKDLGERPVVVGFGPCGIFAGLVLAQMGYKPIILERGKEVRERTKDTFGFWRTKKLNTESNVQFGEGGAGTFSDGKLWTQIKDKKHYGRKVLNEFVAAGAPEEILYVSKPHIGTFKLVSMVEKMRAKIIELGGEIRFSARVDDLHIENGQILGLTLADGTEIKSKHIALAIGHSARDTFQMIHDRGVYVEAKPFSVGFRIEHNQSVIDKALFGQFAGHPILGAADYKLVHHCKSGRSVYSFCMCPGGTVVAATSEEFAVVTNGMSQYSRNERNANSAIVVGIDPSDYPDHPLAGIDLQRQLEKAAYILGGENYDAPAQLVGDFMKGTSSAAIGGVEPSYKPGVKLTDMTSLLPQYCVDAIREAIPEFNKKIRGFAMEDATLTGVETRTSSPVSIKRGDDYQSINTKGFYPSGEGAGYAGGIMSSAIDGIKVAEAMALSMNEQVK